MLKGIEAVLFDLDGSLVDSMWIWKDIDIEYLGRYMYFDKDGIIVETSDKKTAGIPQITDSPSFFHCFFSEIN